MITAPKTDAAVSTLNTLNFQARLQTNPGGAIVPDGFYNVEFKIYNASTSTGSSPGSCTGDANCLWTGSFYDTNGVTVGNDYRVRVAHGYLTVNLGDPSVNSLNAAFPSTINWDQSLYITMNIGGTTQTATPTWNGEMSPRLALTAVPYAFRAGSLAQYNAATGFTSTLSFLQPTVGNQVFQIQDHAAAGTYTVLDNANGFMQGGNSFGATAVLGTSDANALQFKASGTTVLTFTTAANVAYFGNASATGSAAAPTNFTLNGVNSSTAGTTGAKITLKGGNGTSTGTGSDGGDVSLLGGTANGSNARVGGQITITGGVGSATGSGGAINLTTGAGGTTSGGSGAISIQTGTTTNGNTGSIGIQTGNASTGTAGDINIDIGTSSTGAGNINIGTTNGTSTAKTITIGNTGQVGTIKLGQSTATNTISIGSANTATGNTQTVNIAAGTPAGTGNAVVNIGNNVNNTSVGVKAGSGGITLATNGSSAGTIVQSVTSNSASAFQVQNSAGSQILTVDTSGSQVVLGKPGASGVSGKLVFQNSANAFTTTLTTSTSASANYTLTLPTALSGVSGDCLKDTSGTGQLGFANCGAGLSGIGTINVSGGGKSSDGAVISGNNIVLQTADGSFPGLVSTGTQTFAGAKTFSGDTLVKDTSTAAFTVQDAGATNNLIVADTTNTKLSLGTVGSNSLVQLTGIAGGAGSLQAFATNAQSIGGNRVGSSTVTANGYMYVLGGYDGTTYQSTVYYAKINADGSTGAFTTTAAMQAGRAFGSAVVGNNGYVYYLGGTANGTTAQATVYYAKINADGTLGAWATDSTHPITGARIGHTSITSNGYVYVIGGWDGTTYQTTTYYAKIAGDGTLGTWATTATLPAGRAYHSTVVVNGYVYAIGGTTNGTAGNNTVYYAQITTAGTLNAWSTEATNTLPAVRMGATSVVANGYAYVLGGSTNNTTGAVNTVYYSKFNADGSVGTWGTNTNNLINASYQHSSVVVNGYIYIIAGWDGTTRRAAVYYASGARLQVAASLDLIGSTQTDGTNTEQGNDVQDGTGGVGGSIAAGNIFSNGTVQVTGGVQIGGALVLGSTISGAGLTDCSGITSKLLWSAATQQFSCGNDRGSTLVWKPADQTNSIALLTDDTALQFPIAANEQWIFEIDAGVATSGSADNFQFAVTGPSGVGCAMDGISSDSGGSVVVTTFPTFGCGSAQTSNIGSSGQLNISGVVAAGATAGTIKFRFAPTTGSNTATISIGSTLRAYRVTGADYAENYFTKDYSLAPGNVVSIDGSIIAGVQKSSHAYQHDVIGVVSTDPGQVVGDAAGIKQGRPVPIALNGRVPVKIANDSQEIKPGDLITASAQPGLAMKATHAGQVIGKALTGWTPGTANGTVMLFMSVAWGDPNDDTINDSTSAGVTTAQQAGSAQLNEVAEAPKPLEVSDLKASTIVVSGDLSVGGDIKLTGDLQLAGHLITSGKMARIELKPYAGLENGEGIVHKAKVTIGGNDMGGEFTITIGDLPANLQPGELIQVNFDKPYTGKPRILISPNSSESARLQAYVHEVTVDHFTISAIGTPQPGATYDFTYYVFQ